MHEEEVKSGPRYPNHPCSSWKILNPPPSLGQTQAIAKQEGARCQLGSDQQSPYDRPVVERQQGATKDPERAK